MTIGTTTPMTLAGTMTTTRQTAVDLPSTVRDGLHKLIDTMTDEQIAIAGCIEIAAIILD